MMNSRSAKRLIAIAACTGVAYVVPVEAQTLKKEPDANQLSCGQKVLVENNTCPADQILQITGSCLNTTPTIDTVRTHRGTQYNCIKRNQRD
jgi:Family of unknown function (DUF6719)